MQSNRWEDNVLNLSRGLKEKLAPKLSVSAILKKAALGEDSDEDNIDAAKGDLDDDDGFF
jgi:hypothetical protein